MITTLTTIGLLFSGASAFTAPTPARHGVVSRSAISMADKPTGLNKDHGPLVLTLATTGNINTRENNPSLPCSPQEMADQMHECIKLGVSVLHIHSRGEDLKPTMRVDLFRETCRLVKVCVCVCVCARARARARVCVTRT